MILLHLASIVFRGDARVSLGFVVVLGAVTYYCIAVVEVYPLTLGHQLMAIMAAEGAGRSLKTPLFHVRTFGEFTCMLLLALPNAAIATTKDGNNIFNGVHFMSFDYIYHKAFFEKQHYILHSALVVLLLSLASSYSTRLRTSHRVQLVRTFMEPACLVSVAMILMTHSHGDKHHELQSHPVIGTLICIASLLQIKTSHEHLTVPAEPGAPPPDLTTPLPPGSYPSLRLSRYTQAYAYLLLANFLYIDTMMEYLGCREVVVKNGPPGSEVGYSPNSELSTYLSATCVLAAITLGVLSLGDHTASASVPLTPRTASAVDVEYSRVAVGEPQCVAASCAEMATVPDASPLKLKVEQ